MRQTISINDSPAVTIFESLLRNRWSVTCWILLVMAARCRWVRYACNGADEVHALLGCVYTYCSGVLSTRCGECKKAGHATRDSGLG